MAIVPAANPQEFSMVTTTCGAQLMPRKKCKVTLRFSPQSPGAKSSSLTIYDNASNANQLVPLSGKGE
jgi:centrosomal CEP192-like protein